MNKTIPEQIMDILQLFPGQTDTELSTRLGKSHQQINQACRGLERRGLLVRRSNPDKNGNFGNYPIVSNFENKNTSPCSIPSTQSNEVLSQHLNTTHTAKLISQTSSDFYNQLKSDPNGRYRSWEYCYIEFYNARNNHDINIDLLSLHLAFYLASWGMYRGSSFLLQKDYRIHLPAVKEILKEKYTPLFGIECSSLKMKENQILLQELTLFLEVYYDRIRHDVKGDSLQYKLSDVLITKILMGTLGCVPAYDRYFIAGIKREKITTGNYNIHSILKLVEFYESNTEILESTRKQMLVGDILYPQMKLIDMGFWQIGYEMDIEASTHKE